MSSDHAHANVAEPAVRINVRPLANPLPLGLYSFGIGMLLLAAQEAQWAPLKESSQLGVIVASFVFPLEGLSAIMAFLARDTVAATVLGLFSTSWLTVGLVMITGTPGATTVTLGFYLMAFAAAVGALGLLAVMGKPLIAAVLGLSTARAILDGLYEITGSHSLEHAAGYVAAAIAGVAWYAGTALVLEDLRQKAVLPVFRIGAGKRAMTGGLDQQLGRTESEAGVRSQL
jgi:succinate-acetate transporter protein